MELFVESNSMKMFGMCILCMFNEPFFLLSIANFIERDVISMLHVTTYVRMRPNGKIFFYSFDFVRSNTNRFLLSLNTNKTNSYSIIPFVGSIECHVNCELWKVRCDTWSFNLHIKFVSSACINSLFVWRKIWFLSRNERWVALEQSNVLDKLSLEYTRVHVWASRNHNDVKHIQHNFAMVYFTWKWERERESEREIRIW